VAVAAEIPRVDQPALTTLAQLGANHGFVLTDSRRRSRKLVYRVPASVQRRYRYRIVVLRFRVEIDRRRSGHGAGYVNLLTDTGASASAELLTREDRRGLRTDWDFGAVRGGRSGSSRRGRLSFRFENHMLLPDSHAGTHRLSFQLQEYGHFHVRRVTIDPRSGLRLTRDPPFPLSMRVGVQQPRSLVVGRPTTVAVQLRNSGASPVAGVRVGASADDGLEVSPPPGFAHWPVIRGGRLLRRTISVTPTRPGLHALRLHAASRFGSPRASVRLRAVGAGAGGPGTSVYLAGALAIAAAGAAFALVRLRAPGRRA
jgi:hypothetical protein